MQNIVPSVLPILRTDTQRELLIELFFGSGRPRTLSDLARSIGVDQTTVMREVNRLLESGLVVEERVGRARTVEIDDSSPFAGPLRQLIRVVHQPSSGSPEERRPPRHDRRGPANDGPTHHDRRPLPSSRRRD